MHSCAGAGNFCSPTIVPPDNACSKLPEVKNGAVVYSDLNLGAGCVARYICSEGYTLQSIRGQKKFVCDEYGAWNGDTTTAPVECLCECGMLIIQLIMNSKKYS